VLDALLRKKPRRNRSAFEHAKLVAVQLYEKSATGVWAASRPGLLLRELTLASRCGGRRLDFPWPGGQPAPYRDYNWSCPAPGLWMAVGGNGMARSTLLRLQSAGLLEPGHGHIPLPVKAPWCSRTPITNLLFRVVPRPAALAAEGLDPTPTQDPLGPPPWPRWVLAGFEPARSTSPSKRRPESTRPGQSAGASPVKPGLLLDG